ncbi:CcdB family protein [Lichenicoccus sp.]|uniref:CcdB family protein n=1 Tax=Lichenicoccus sp. TaxID=2781899 RepID=UPI003D0ACB47
MARLDIHPMPGGGAGYVVNVQADLLTHLSTRVVVPLLPEATSSSPISELNPVFEIEGGRYVLVTQALAAIPGSELKRSIGSLDAEHDSVTRSLDLLLVGF